MALPYICVVLRGAEEERQAARRRLSAALIGGAVATLALVALALNSPSRRAHSSTLAVKAGREASAQTRAAQVKLAHATSKLWTHDSENADSSTQRVAVSEDDISNLGLRAPSGFNVPAVDVTDDDVSRYVLTSVCAYDCSHPCHGDGFRECGTYHMFCALASLLRLLLPLLQSYICLHAYGGCRLGLHAPAGFNVPNVNVSEDDIDRLGLRAPNGYEIPEMVVTDADMERYGLTPLTASAGSAGGSVAVSPEDVERYGLVAPQGWSARHNITVTQQDIARLGLTNPSITEDEARALGIFGDGPEVTDEDIDHYGMVLNTPSAEEAAALGLSNSTIRLTAEQAEALGLSGPLSITPEEAQALGLSQAAAGALVTEDDMDRLGLHDPAGWNATGYSHLKGEQQRLKAASIQLRARRAVQQLLNQKLHVARKRLSSQKGGH